MRFDRNRVFLWGVVGSGVSTATAFMAFRAPFAVLGTLLAAGIFIMFLLRPLWLLYITAAVLPVWPAFEIYDISITPLEPIAFLLFIVTVYRCFVSGQALVFFRSPNPWLIAFICVAVLGAFLGAPDSTEALNSMRKVLFVPVMVYFSILGLARSYAVIMRILLIFTVSNSLITGVAVFLHFVSYPELRLGYPITSSVFLGLCCVIGVAIGGYMHPRLVGVRRRCVELLIVIQLLGLVLTLSRMPMLCLIMMPAANWILFRSRMHRVLVRVVLVLGIACIALLPLLSWDAPRSYGDSISLGTDRVINWRDYRDSRNWRLENWRIGFDVFLASPWIGNGFYPFYKLGQTWRTTRLAHPHNLVLNLLISSGVGGGAAFILYLIGVFRISGKAAFGRPAERGLIRVLLLCCGTVLLNGMANGIFIWVPFASLLFLCLASLLVLSQCSREVAPSRRCPR